jgi:opacity protein-like surface antigen
MSLRKGILTAGLAVLVSTLAPSRASADWLLTPFVGATFGGSADFGSASETFENDFKRNFTYGASLGWMGHGAVGFEIDFGYTPNFFESSDNLNDIDLVGDGNVTTLMGNFLVGAPLGGVRPYAVAGLGLIKSRVDDVGQFFGEVDKSNLGFDVGGGVMAFFGDSVGIRGDIRYFRNIQDTDLGDLDVTLGDLDFWRGTVGVTFRF